LLHLGEETFRGRFKGSPIKRAKRKGFLRNVVIAVGNSRDPDLIEPLKIALEDPEPLIRSHTAWALGQLGSSKARRVLDRALSSEPDLHVKKELEIALER
jgi:epoxyqueuosine reductase